MQTTEGGEGYELTLVATGDSLITRRLSVFDEERFLHLIKVIREADVAFTNLEITVHDFQGYPGPREATGGSWLVSPPYIADELKWAGFNLLSRANNHAMDWSIGGMLTTSEILDRAGLVYAGVGRNLSGARSPAYLDTKRGRVALISAASSFPSVARAGEARRDMKGRPGVNPLRYDTQYVINADGIKKLEEISSMLGLKEEMKGNEFNFLRKRFVLGESPGVYRTANKSDVEGNLRSIKEARRQADWVLVTLHAHEHVEVREVPAEFIVLFAHECIDAGADAYIGHGAHVLQGIEIYRGKPIFYGLGNIIHQQTLVTRVPEESYERCGLGGNMLATPADVFDADQLRLTPEDLAAHAGPMGKGLDTILAWSTFKNKKLTEVKLYPVSLGRGKPRPQLGRPMLADEELGRKIIEHMKEISSPYGTEIEYKDGVGLIEL